MAIGNPWGAAAQSYGQDLDQLTKIQMGGMQQAAQMPLQLYDRFMDGYEKARQRASAEKAEELRQAQLERQNRIAEDNAIHQRQQDLVARDRLTQQDEIASMDRSMSYIKDLDSRFTGDPGMARAEEEMAKQNKIRGITEYLKNKKIGAKPADPALQSALGAEGLMAPDQAYATPESYQPGTGYQLKEAQQKEANRKATEQLEFDKAKLGLTLAQQKAIADQASEDRRFLGGLAASGRGETRKVGDDFRRSNAFWNDKRSHDLIDEKMTVAEAKAAQLFEHKGLPEIAGIKSKFPNWPGGEAAKAQALLDFLKSQGTLEELTKLRQSSPTGGAVGNASDRDMQLLQNAYANLDQAQDYETLRSVVNEIRTRTASIKKRNAEFFAQKHGGGPGAISDLAGEYAPSAPGGQPGGGTITMQFPNGAKKVVPASERAKWSALGGKEY